MASKLPDVAEEDSNAEESSNSDKEEKKSITSSSSSSSSSSTSSNSEPEVTAKPSAAETDAPIHPTTATVGKKGQDRLMLDELIKAKQQQAVGLLSSNIKQIYHKKRSYEDYLKESMEASGASNVFFKDPTSEQMMRASDSSLKTYFHLKRFQPDEENTSINYIEELFSKMPTFSDQLKKWEEEANKEREIAVKAELINGRGLPPLDSDGTSDPYCKIVILNKQHYNKKIVQKENISSWIEAGLVKKEGVALSTVQPSTLDPDWDNETYELPISAPEEEYLVVEVWDSSIDDHKKKIVGLRGLGRYFSHSDEFMGRSFYLLKDLTSREELKSLQLYSHSAKHERGVLTLKLNIIEKGAGIQSEDKKAKEYANILQVIITNETKKDDNFICNWSGEIPERGKNLLAQVVSIRGLTKLRVATIHFSQLMDYYKSYSVSLSAVQLVMNEIMQFEIQLTQLRGSSPTPSWVLKFFQEVQELYTSIIDTLSAHLDRFNFKLESDVEEFKNYIILLKLILECELFRKEMELQDTYDQIISTALQDAVLGWLSGLRTKLMPNIESSVDEVTVLKSVCSHCVDTCHVIIARVQPALKEIGIDYFTPFYCTLDGQLYPEVKTAIDKCTDNDIHIVAYELYLTLHKLKSCVKFVDKKFLSSEQAPPIYIPQYHVLFKDMVSVWMDICQSRARERLQSAVEDDTPVVGVTVDQAPFSSSVVDTCGVMRQMIEFWQDLDWPDREQSLDYFAMFLQGLSDMVMYYADIVTMNISSQETNNEGKEEDSTADEKLYMCLNNVHHVKSTLRGVGEELHLSEYYVFLDEESSDHLLSEKAEITKNNIISIVGQDIEEKKKFIVRKIHNKIIPPIENKLATLMHAKADVPSDKVIEPLLKYVAETIGKLAESLLSETLVSVLEELWDDIIKMISDESSSLAHKSSTVHKFGRLKDILSALPEYFTGESGLSRGRIETETYEALVQEIHFASLLSEKLIRDFVNELMQQQQDALSQYGELQISHTYNASKKVVKVIILSAQDLPSITASKGKTGTYVVVHLLPAELFPKASDKGYKTSVKKKTVQPVFNEKIKMPANVARLSEDGGGIVLMAMFKHEKFTKDDLIGIAVLPTSKVPTGDELKTEHLNLFHYKTTPTFNELEKRVTENVAHNFLKLMKKFTVHQEDHEL